MKCCPVLKACDVARFHKTMYNAGKYPPPLENLIFAGGERERGGSCIANLSYVIGSMRESLDASGVPAWTCAFKSAPNSSDIQSGMSSCLPERDLQQIGISEGELVAVSVDGEQYRKGIGAVMGGRC
jgi:hypothetical protein